MTKMKTFTVTGTSRFPIDMLRYDRATPATEVDSSAITGTLYGGAAGRYVAVQVRAEKLTAGRWASFGWTVQS